MNDAVILTPISYRLMAEAAEKLRNQVIASGHPESELWLAIADGHLLNLLLAGTVLACVELENGRLARIAPASWRSISLDVFTRVAMSGFAPLDYCWDGVRDRPMLVNDADFERIAAVLKMLPTSPTKSPSRPKTSDRKKVLALATDFWKRNPMSTKEEALNHVRAAGLVVTDNAWKTLFLKPSRSQAGLEEKMRAGRPSKSVGQKSRRD